MWPSPVVSHCTILNKLVTSNYRNVYTYEVFLKILSVLSEQFCCVLMFAFFPGDVKDSYKNWQHISLEDDQEQARKAGFKKTLHLCNMGCLRLVCFVK